MSNWTYSLKEAAHLSAEERLRVLGKKASGLVGLFEQGYAVPPAFVIGSACGESYIDEGGVITEPVRKAVKDAIVRLGRQTRRSFGGKGSPLALAIRFNTGRAASRSLDTILNIGLSDQSAAALADEFNDPKFAFDSYRRLIENYAVAVMDIDPEKLEEITLAEQSEAEISQSLPSAESSTDMVEKLKRTIEETAGQSFPQDPFDQFWGVVETAFSRLSAAASAVPGVGTPDNAAARMPIIVQAMVFGNLQGSGQKISGAGRIDTRHPRTGEKGLHGVFLPLRQGTDLAIAQVQMEAGSGVKSMDAAPGLLTELRDIADRLETSKAMPQRLEFTVERGRIWLLQSEVARLSADATMKTAVDMVQEGLISREDAISRIDPGSIDQSLHQRIDPAARRDILTRGLPASPGAASGIIVFTAADAAEVKAKEKDVILVRAETGPEDVQGIHAADAVLTLHGGMTSHAAVVARGLGKPCVTAASAIRLDMETQTFTAMGRTFSKGDWLTIDGSAGEVLAGKLPLLQPALTGDFAVIMEWSDAVRRMAVRANVDTPEDARAALNFGAEGIGLCRTEHMFFQPGRIIAMRQMILARDEKGRKEWLDKLLSMQRSDFEELFQIMGDLPVTIRLLDPPLHEFLPSSPQEIAAVAASLGVEENRLRERLVELQELNPMLGHRGCRLAISYPEIAEMQTRAIIEAALNVRERTGKAIEPEIMVPLVGLRDELLFVKERVDAVAADVVAARGREQKYLVGTMIELPRASVRAAAIAEVAEFFSFGTNDLTQTVLGISRDDAAPFLQTYQRKGLIERDPFVTLDIEGVGEFIRMACEGGRSARPDLKLGICGEHAGDPPSIRFCEEIGLDYISCSPFRVPIARLAAAQSVIVSRKKSGKTYAVSAMKSITSLSDKGHTKLYQKARTALAKQFG